MACISIKNKTISRSMLVGNTPFDPAATWLIQRVAGTGSSNTITFSSIPSTYQHLQIRGIYFPSAADAINLLVRFNSDTGSNYATHWLKGYGTTAPSANGLSSTSSMRAFSPSIYTGPTYAVATIIDVLDYASTSKYKTMRARSGTDSNSLQDDGENDLTSGLWMNTNAVNSISLILSANNFTTNTTFALYGIKGV